MFKLDFISQIFAQIFAKFKQKNPTAAGVIALVLLVVVYAADQGTFLGVFTLPTWAADTIKWVGSVLLAVNGASTHQYQTDGSVNG
jgi:hypothetical protein